MLQVRWQCRRAIRRLASVVRRGKHSQTVSIADAEPAMNASYSAQHVGALCAANVHVSAGAGEGIAIIDVWSGIVGVFLGIRGWQSVANVGAGHVYPCDRGREVSADASQAGLSHHLPSIDWAKQGGADPAREVQVDGRRTLLYSCAFLQPANGHV